ncbi:2-C-methyl-D-erythritol 2,4-cyclodiphosphate synthase [Sphaerochaeta pleomorpha str. Grapes]|uniref:2-C-methyl-D-erythritol 2,4-cyclodiphosphate synthase n=1 Tax=Sphaerochaeta pleomorpha (strain ATCC BAA-1885 / DSM 22778 / Grapes) TaxID=158190 RepID=G8QT93_SPHPG|nr:2-C-methyl-D-erythritol 2,4-cyclodiphosphate synthase [Sphaerochaeta pleomorpha]AEV29060.1 2-C-methyl-D-erythritol 2,4-cyclodiphosphate synthase [Sphaerochaeta pleomorpha str. Grapes]
MRIGTGWDIHPLVEDRKLILGGCLIPHDKGEAAHSDGDVLIHAIIDAILGALAKGDIGSHFPDNDSRFKNADSLLLLQQIRKEELDGKCTISNIDCTVILQKPKLRPYIDMIRDNLSQVLNLQLDQISVKAKTAEGMLNEVGTGDAIIAQAVVLLSPISC